MRILRLKMLQFKQIVLVCICFCFIDISSASSKEASTSLDQQLINVSLKSQKKVTELSAYRGQVIYLDFWASWCGPCIKSLPWMNAMQTKYASMGFKVISINLDEDIKDAKVFLKQYPANFEVFYDPAGQIAEQLSVSGMPTSIMIDRAGRLHSQHVGFNLSKSDYYEQLIVKLIEATPIIKE
jgi:cytochrome c biogenesis protein CcmG, thiol:disulfide interchange protein DsbE